METLIRSFPQLLHKSGFKATQGRLALLRTLAEADRPLSTPDIVKQLGKKANQATVYRGLEALASTGMIRRVDMQHAHAHYELQTGTKHHHHIICTVCHQVEDIEECALPSLERTLLKHSRKFSIIESHALEFFGICDNCTIAKEKQKSKMNH